MRIGVQRRPWLAFWGATATLVLACSRPPAPPTEVEAFRVASLPVDAEDKAWDAASTYTAQLIPQDMVEPRLIVPSTRTVNVQALTDGNSIAFRLMWDDDTQSDVPGPGSFADACAVQLPTQAGPDLPAPQMGEPHKGVAICYWSAAWQAEIDGRELSVKNLYPNSYVGHYPFEAPSLTPGSEEQVAMAKRYAPARAADRPGHGDGVPVQDLQAEGPGTLTAQPVTASRGRGVRTPTGWDVVIVRELPAALRGVERTQVAVAIWQGSLQESGARKMRSVWIPLALGVTS